MTSSPSSLARCVMVLGTSSDAGKSWLATALCRYYANQGLRVAPFKAQNMSNNTRLVPLAQGGYGEVASAQYFQALAARVRPDVRMSPLVLKPVADQRSQVVLLGQPDAALSALPWRGRSQQVWPQIAAALDALRASHDVVVIEGAGSPAEINLHSSDVVNMRVARHAQAACLLVSDIDRGGAFAHLYGTWALLPKEEQALIRGFVLNKFRGDAGLLAPAPQLLQEKTGVPVVATIPMQMGHGLPQEDGVSATANLAPRPAAGLRIAVVAYPRISHLDEFAPLQAQPGVELRWVRSPAELANWGGAPTGHADWIILPGSQAPAQDLAWLRVQGLDAALAEHARAGGAVLGLGAGLLMLGEGLVDLDDVAGNGPGLGLLPLVNTVEGQPRRHPLAAQPLGRLHGCWQALSGVPVQGQVVLHGQTAQHPAMAAAGDVAQPVLPGLAWQNRTGNVLGLQVHGLFENPAVCQALFGSPTQPSEGAYAPPHGAVDWEGTLEPVFDRMAAGMPQWFAPGVLQALLQ